jgi:hypothetical protein
MIGSIAGSFRQRPIIVTVGALQLFDRLVFFYYISYNQKGVLLITIKEVINKVRL